MPKYRKKPVAIEAWRVRDLLAAAQSNWSSLPIAVRDAYDGGGLIFCSECVHVRTLEGTMIANIDDWLINGVAGEFYPVKPAIFEATYEPEVTT